MSRWSARSIPYRLTHLQRLDDLRPVSPCPYCRQPLPASAVRCRECGEVVLDLDDLDLGDDDPDTGEWERPSVATGMAASAGAPGVDPRAGQEPQHGIDHTDLLDRQPAATERSSPAPEDEEVWEQLAELLDRLPAWRRASVEQRVGGIGLLVALIVWGHKCLDGGARHLDDWTTVAIVALTVSISTGFLLDHRGPAVARFGGLLAGTNSALLSKGSFILAAWLFLQVDGPSVAELGEAIQTDTAPSTSLCMGPPIRCAAAWPLVWSGESVSMRGFLATCPWTGQAVVVLPMSRQEWWTMQREFKPGATYTFRGPARAWTLKGQRALAIDALRVVR